MRTTLLAAAWGIILLFGAVRNHARDKMPQPQFGLAGALRTVGAYSRLSLAIVRIRRRPQRKGGGGVIPRIKSISNDTMQEVDHLLRSGKQSSGVYPKPPITLPPKTLRCRF